MTVVSNLETVEPLGLGREKKKETVLPHPTQREATAGHGSGLHRQVETLPAQFGGMGSFRG
jgi:hypothetical protein